MGAGDKTQTPSRIPSRKSEATQAKLATTTEARGPSENESQLKERIKDCDWSELESSYMQMMEEHEKAEGELRDQITKLLQIFTSWSQTTVAHDETRALKRFRTQMNHVQNSEESLEKKRNHYMDVVKAFESALALLNDRVRP
ncbi:hypothetical protein ASPCAL11395 [Aspergillus calidoustus]|uniref:Uncharacterized protein n=1 Tax=Aspergillus calidoustus TaxID=454130 RepID=A0A0U5H313_ASPCI|nr:hypothetical protein ASPCAL11395 [Aspergillus calidoustus]